MKKFMSPLVIALTLSTNTLPAASSSAASVQPVAERYSKRLFQAVANNQMFEVSKLIKKGANLLAQNEEGFTVLYLAVLHNNIECLNTIILYAREKNILNEVLNAQTREWRQTPLHAAAAMDRKSCVRALLEAGANTTLKNGMGRTAAEHGRHNDYTELAMIIENYGKEPKQEKNKKCIIS
ncbi:ankyrin repeat domain-containing protein [Candidatus Babeliales bacterium]|nr:ankyrin repeat domain-containing protein [Candidatus Babeliales bacterium]